MGPLMEDVGHGRARKVGTDKVFRVRRYDDDQVMAEARSGQPDVYSGREIDEPTQRYYVWLLNPDNTPVDEGPYGPMALTPAKYNARIGAEHGRHARAVTYGADPNAETFEVVRIYPAGG